ncbi:MAG: hypothetical protein FWB75_03190 [Oscillospiraceae bacterium]|nr:hypothetical protein [Oscillospiraceae bacterium]
MESPLILFTVLIISQYGVLKILDLKLSGKKQLKVISGVLLSALLVYGANALVWLLPSIRFVLIVLILAVFLSATTKSKFSSGFTATVISVGISYGIIALCAIASATIVFLVTQSTGYAATAAATGLTVLMGCAVIILLFRIRRFKRGMLFLKEKAIGTIGLFLSISIMLSLVFVYILDANAEQGVWIVIIIALCLIGLIGWWRRGLTKLYRKRMTERNIQEYIKIAAEKDDEIRLLRKDNELMAKLIHRDNKLLPSLIDSVVLLHRNSVEKPQENQDEAGRILEHIQQLMADRAKVLKLAQPYNEKPTLEENTVLSGLLGHMATRAAKEEIEFETSVQADTGTLIVSYISTLKFQTLCADLIENAIIATAKSKCKKILFTFTSKDNVFEICVQDSGMSFELETLANLGITKTSTHLDDGGSGIGYMTIFEIIRECNASLVISEYCSEPCSYTKSVSIRFDGNFSYNLLGGRANEFKAMRDALTRPNGSISTSH